MSTRTTILMFLAVLALGAVILGIERYFPSAVQMREIKKGPGHLDREKITDIEITDANGAAFKLARKDGVWHITEPYADLADPEKVAALVLGVDAVEWVERVSRAEFDEKEWGKTGLDNPRFKVRLKAGDTTLQECWFGAPAVLENTAYVSYPARGGGDVESTSYVSRMPHATNLPGVLDVLQAAQNSWRDPKLLRLPEEAITSITLTQSSGQIELVRENEHMPWVLMKPLKTRGSKDRINELLSILLNIEIVEAKDATPAAANATASAGAVATVPADEIRVHVQAKARKQAFDLTIKKPADPKETTTTATTGYRKPVFTIAAKNLARLWVEPNSLRDHMLAQINAEMLASIVINSASFPEIKLRNENGSWFVERRGNWDGANGERLTRMLEALNTHEITEFSADTAADLAPFGLDKPFQTIMWSYPRFKPIKLLFGSNEAGTEFFAKYEDEPFVFRIDPSLLPSLPPDPIKWKGLGALRYTTFALRRITMSYGAAPPLVLNYDPVTADWTGTQAGNDMTEKIDRVKADRLSNKLAKFTVQDWSGSRSDAIQALKTPLLRIQVILGEPGKKDGALREVNLIFSPTQPNATTAFLYGQIEGDPDIFYISRRALEEIVQPPFKDKPGMK